MANTPARSTSPTHIGQRVALCATCPALSESIDHLLPILDYNIRNGKTYMYNRNEPLFVFGHGLSYTSFEYSELKMDQSAIKDGGVVNISLNVKNTGSINSDEVIQLYISFPDSNIERPIKALKGFKRVHIPAGESKTVTIPLSAGKLKYWNEEKHAFVLEKGQLQLMVGASSEDIRQTGTIEAK